MNTILKKFVPKMKKGIIYGFASGFVVGCFPNKLSIHFGNRKYVSIPTPLISGVIGSMGIVFSPLLLMNYLCNGVYFDKIVDKYDIRVERYHQYDGENNKYAFPSLFIINIQPKP